MTKQHLSRWAEVDLDAVQANVRVLRGRLRQPTRLAAVVKADGYGHGAVAVAGAAVAAGADWLAVATAGEGVVLAEAGIKVPILILGPVLPTEVEPAVRAGLRLSLHDGDGLALVRAAAESCGREVPVHLKINTGMNRLGAAPAIGLELAKAIEDAPGVRLEGLWTHFADADNPASGNTARQLATFTSVLEQVRGAGISPELVHCCNSAATLLHPEAHFNLVRCGLPIYGYSPCGELPGLELRPALTWKARVVALHHLQAGEAVGYGGEFVATAPTRVATLSAGYADGYPRRLGGAADVLVRGRRVPTVGRVSMDYVGVRVDGVDGVEIGDEAILLGAQGEEFVGADELAAHLGTIPYEVLCGIGPRVIRRPVGAGHA